MSETIFLGNRTIGVDGFGLNELGGVERRNPLPPGRYWIDLFQQDSDAWLAWRARNATNVKIEETEHFDSTPSRDFIIFKVTSAVPWEGPGFPTIADPSVKSASDTSDRPPPTKDPLDKVIDAMSSPKGVGITLTTMIGGGVILYLLGRSSRSK